MVDVVSLMAGRYLEGGGGEVATWPQPKGGRGESPLACIDNTGKEGQGGDVCNFFMVLGKSVFRINPTVFMKVPPGRHPSHVREC